MTGTSTQASSRRPKDQLRIPLSMRITPEIRERLVATAAETGRSITQEAELRIAQSFLIERLLPTRLIEVMQAFEQAGTEFAEHYGVEGDWSQNRDGFWCAMVSAVERLLVQAPGAWDGDHLHAGLEQALAQAQHIRLRAVGLTRGEGFISAEERAETSADAPKPRTKKRAA